MAFALEHFPTFPYPPRGMQEVNEIEQYLTNLHRSMQEFFSTLPRDIKDGISVVDLDDLANTTLADPDADRIVFWDDGAGVYTWLTANTGLAISTTNLNLSHLGLESLTAPGADRIFFWDHSELASKWLAPDGTSLEISTTTLQVVAAGIDDTHIDWGTGTNQVSAVDVPIADAGSYYTGTEVETALQEAMTELKVHQLTGFEDASSVALSTDSGNPPTVTLTFTGTVYWWSDGVRYSDSGTDALQIANSSGVHWIYYDGAALSSQVNPSDAELDAIITDKAFVSIVYFNATTNASYVVANELHGAEMSGETHRWLHENIGSRYHGGLTISGYTLDTATNVALTFEITDGSLYDEDLLIAISDGTAANQYEQQLSGGDASIPVLYRNAAGEWTEQAASTLPYIVSGTTLRFMDADNSYTQTSLGNNQYMNMFLVATNDWQYPIKMIQGTDEYSQIDYVQGAVAAEIVDWSTLPSAEWVLLYQIILKQASGESVDGKIIDVIDYRFTGITGASATSQDHGSLSGLGDNDHGAVYYTETEIDTWRNSVTQAEMGYLNGLTSDLQTQLDARCLESILGTSIGAGLLLDGAVLKTDVELQAIAGLTSAADRYIRFTGSGSADLRTYANVLADLSGSAGAAFAWNSQNLTGVGTIGCGGITATGLNMTTPGQITIDAGINTDADFVGTTLFYHKTAGASDVNDHFYGTYTIAEMNQNAGTISHMYGGLLIARLTDGEIGDVTHAKLFIGQVSTADLNAGKLWGKAFGLYAQVDQEAATETTGDVYGVYSIVAMDGTHGGTAHMLYLDEGNNVDYGIYQNGTAPNVLGGPLFCTGLKSGATQVAAGAAANELYHDTDDNTIKIGV